MAESLGKRLLMEVKEERLDEVTSPKYIDYLPLHNQRADNILASCAFTTALQSISRNQTWGFGA